MAITRLIVRSPNEIRNSYLRTYRVGLIDRGVPNPNVTAGSEAYVLAQAIANELSVGEANAIVKADASLPDTAQDEDLEEGAAQYGIVRRPAIGSVGTIVLDVSATSPVAGGTQLLDDQGKRYEVTTAGTYDDAALIPIRSLDAGSDSNLAEGTSLRWVSAPPYSAPTALVGPDGLRDGYDEETLEELRARWLARLQSPPAGGNPQDIAETAEKASPSVQKAFVYPALYGPGTVHVAVAGRPTTTNKDRDVATSIVTSTVAPIVATRYPGQAYIKTTTVENYWIDVVLKLALPAAASSSPPGPGGGWLDGSPFPSISATVPTANVTNVTSTTVMRVKSATPPVAGVARVAFLSPLTWELMTATVITQSTYAANEYTITLDTPFTGIAVGNYLFPQSLNQQLYIDAALVAFSLMGPGELSANASVLERASRKPLPYVSWPYSVDSAFTKRIQDVGTEVLRAEISYLTTVGGVLSLSSPAPPIPTGTEPPPYIYVPRNLGFYQAT